MTNDLLTAPKRSRKPRKKSKIKLAEEKIESLEKEIIKLNIFLKAVKLKEIEMEVNYRREQMNFATHRLDAARANFSNSVENGYD